MRYRTAIFTNIAPLYSRSLWHTLSSSYNIEYSFYSSAVGFSGIKTIDINESKSCNKYGKLNWFFLKNVLFKQYIFYQTGLISKCLNTDYDAYILYGEMHSISNWIAALVCKIRKKPLLIWGHGLKGNEKYLKRILRLLYYQIADYHLVYGNRSRNLMIESGFDPLKIYTVYNSLDFSAHKVIYASKNLNDLDALRERLFPKTSKLPVIIFIGRLTREKKISYLLEAVSLCKKRGNVFNCLIVGNGSELDNLRKLSISLDIGDMICFYGSCYDESINGKLIMLSECCVSPGNVGLTAIHSLSFGTPVITHENYFNQGPEVEAVIQNKTGLFFEENNIESLSMAIDDIIINRRKTEMETFCIEQVDKLWNPMNQASVFEEAILESIKKQHH